jgi:hypothetical protein
MDKQPYKTSCWEFPKEYLNDPQYKELQGYLKELIKYIIPDTGILFKNQLQGTFIEHEDKDYTYINTKPPNNKLDEAINRLKFLQSLLKENIESKITFTWTTVDETNSKTIIDSIDVVLDYINLVHNTQAFC